MQDKLERLKELDKIMRSHEFKQFQQSKKASITREYNKIGKQILEERGLTLWVQ